MNEKADEELSGPQVLALAECMLSTARVDGLHPKEEELIRAFYEQQRHPGMPDYAAVAATASQGPVASLAPLSGDAGFAEQLLLMCLMTGYADGRLSDAERAHVAAFAQALAVPPQRLDELLLQVKDSLIGSLAHLPEPESVAALAKTL